VAATNISLGESQDASTWIADDAGSQKVMTACLTDDDTTAACNVGSVAKIGKAPDDILRIELPNLSTIVAGDTVTFEITATHNIGTFALLPYTSTIAVSDTNKITVAGGTGSKVFTLTSSFISDLFDQGGGTWAARLTEDAGISGDFQLAEVDSDLTAAPAAPSMDSWHPETQQPVQTEVAMVASGMYPGKDVQ